MESISYGLHLGDCLDLMPRIASGSVDMVLADLPYGTTACKWDSIIPLDQLWSEYRRVCKPSAAMVFTASQPFTTKLISSNMDEFRYCWVWEKSCGSNFLLTNIMPMKVHEDVCVFYRELPIYNPQYEAGRGYTIKRQGAVAVLGEQEVRVGGAYEDDQRTPRSVHKVNEDYEIGALYCRTCRALLPDVTVANPNRSVLQVTRETGDHPTQKPIELMEYFIKTYTDFGDLILDNTMGSGTTCIAARQLGRRYIGVEKDPVIFEAARRRVLGFVRLDPVGPQLGFDL